MLLRMPTILLGSKRMGCHWPKPLAHRLAFKLPETQQPPSRDPIAMPLSPLCSRRLSPPLALLP
jgi:hypothetical protein